MKFAVLTLLPAALAIPAAQNEEAVQEILAAATDISTVNDSLEELAAEAGIDLSISTGGNNNNNNNNEDDDDDPGVNGGDGEEDDFDPTEAVFVTLADPVDLTEIQDLLSDEDDPDIDAALEIVDDIVAGVQDPSEIEVEGVDGTVDFEFVQERLEEEDVASALQAIETLIDGEAFDNEIAEDEEGDEGQGNGNGNGNN